MTKDDMLTLVRSVAVPHDVEQGMAHAYDLGVEWERARVEKILIAWIDGPIHDPKLGDILQDVRNGNDYHI